MPLPSPKGKEKQSDFIGRCMGSAVMKKEYEDKDQRLAVCYSQWRKAKKKSNEEETMKFKCECGNEMEYPVQGATACACTECGNLAEPVLKKVFVANDEDKATEILNFRGLRSADDPVGDAVRLIEVSAQLLANESALVRTEVFNGEEHWVIPTIMIVEGVLNELFYSASEIEKFPEAWNGCPIPVFHPEQAGQNFTANDPQVIEEQCVGYMFNCYYENKRLKGEAWINKKEAAAKSPLLVQMIENGEMVEVSTGLWCEHDGTPGQWKGEKFKASVFNFRPDHLAVLPGGKGACSIADGAGMGRTNDRKEKEDEMNEKKARQLGLKINDAIRVGDSKINELSHEEIWTEIRAALTVKHGGFDSGVYLNSVYNDFFVFVRETDEGSALFKQAYSIDKNDKVVFDGDAEEVVKQVSFEPISSDNDDKGTGNSTQPDAIDQTKGGSTMERKDRVDALIANDKCDLGEEDRDFLMELEDERFDRIAKPFEAANADDGDGDGGDGDGDAGDGGDGDGDAGDGDGGAANSDDGTPKKQTVEEFLATIQNEEIRETLVVAHATHAKAKAALVKQLAENENCDFTEAQLKAMNIEQLRSLIKLSGSQEPETVGNFAGAAPAPMTLNFSKTDDVPKMPRLFENERKDKKKTA